MTSRAPNMLTPIADESCPNVALPIPPKTETAVCSENNSFVQFTDQVEKKGVGTPIKIGLAVDKKLVDILGSVSNTVVNGLALTAAYTALMLIFPDIEEKVKIHQDAATKGWEAAQAKKQSEEGFSAGYINYLSPPTKSQQKWIAETEIYEQQLEQTQNPFVRVLAKANHTTQSLIPTSGQVQKGIVKGTAKAITLAARATAATVKGVSRAVYDIADEASDMSLSENPKEETAEQKIARYGGYLDTMSNMGTFFNNRHQYFNRAIPPYLQWIGPLAPYAVIGSLVALTSPGWAAGGVIAAAWPFIEKAAAWAIKGSQVVANVKSNAAIDSVKFVLLKLHEVLKSTKIPADQYSDLFARAIVAISCPVWTVRESDEKLFSPVEKKNVSTLLYFLRYASYAYCLDPSTLNAADFADCVKINKQFSRRYYTIMDNVKGVEGFKKHLVNFFLVYDLTIGCFVASFQGTTTLDDLLLDAFGLPSPLSFTDRSVKNSGGEVKGFAHEAMLKVAQNCVALLLEKLKKDHPFYLRVPMIVTGHSLGAGVAAISALLLRQQGLQTFCLGIATPACLSPDLAVACESFTVSIINNSDIVPRLSECGLFNLTSSDRVCTRSDVVKLVTPGNALWMREKIVAPEPEENETLATQELVQLRANSEFSTSILARIDCLTAHGTGSYLASLKSVDPVADPDAIDFDFSFLFPNLPQRKLEPEFLMLYLPANVADAIKGCFTKRELAKVQRAEKRSKQELTPQLFSQYQDQCNKIISEITAKYTAAMKENNALQEKLAKLNKGIV